MILGFCKRCGKATDEHDSKVCPNPDWQSPAPLFGVGGAPAPAVSVSPTVKELVASIPIQEVTQSLLNDAAQLASSLPKEKRVRKPVKKKRRKQPVSSQSRNMQAAILALIEGYGHGGLSWMAKQLGLTPSTLRQRLISVSGGFDAATMLGAVLLMESRSDKFNPDGMTASEPVESGMFVVTKYTSEDGNAVTWRVKE